ncbi:class I SAM-dependent methyltransferase [Streptomyces lydicus]|uniref:class I SAM-dependent methyltransferase n=1 Tax=Streptomyces lydicus TaxID=47763 RepID=UPI0037008552
MSEQRVPTHQPTSAPEPARGDHEGQTLNSFYGAFPYPWSPHQLTTLDDPAFYTRFLCQDVGDDTGGRVPVDADIWVAGCGTNQALITALRFPGARVLGTDASENSLALCEANARSLGVSNLTLRHEGLTKAAYREQFDYVLCTGVIHHNPDPAVCLRSLAAALRPDAVLELMVYNTYHRQEMIAFQKALTLMGIDQVGELPERLALARGLGESVPADGLLGRKMEMFEYTDEAAWADSWMSPLEHSYSVEELAAMADGCGLALETPTVNAFDQVSDSNQWDVPVPDGELRARYDALPDPTRWQLVNLLLMDRSPMLWFYLGRAGRPRRTEAERDRAFLDTVHRHSAARQRRWTRRPDGGYQEAAATTAFPAAKPPAAVRPLYEAVDGERTIRQLLADLGGTPTPAEVRRARLQLTSSQFPFLVAAR